MIATKAPTAFRLTSLYDRMRLSIYKARGARGHCIAIADVGASTFLRFDDVGYFNVVYGHGNDIADQFDLIDAFFHGSRHGCRLLSPGLDDTGVLADACRQRGWVPDEHVAWLSGPCRVPRGRQGPIAVRPARRDEVDVFFRTYLAAFDAPPAAVPAAIDNMRHLFDEETLSFLVATLGDEPAGVGMLLRHGADAMLCAGAMIPRMRNLGGHEALLTARLALARDLGCTEVHSWARRDGRSHANMLRAGLRTVMTGRCWRRLPRHEE